MQSRILVVRFGSLGDVILTSATVINLRLAYPDSEIVYLTRERYRCLVERFFGVDRVETVPDHVSLTELFRRLLQIESGAFDQIVDLHGNFRSWFARSMLTANARYVYPKRRLERWRVTRRRKTLPAEYPHTIDLYNDIILRQGKPAHCQRPLIGVPSPSPQFAPILATEKPIVLIAPGAAHLPKAWPVERFGLLAKELHARWGARIVWAVTAGERSAYGLPGELKSSNIIELVDCTLDQVAALAGSAKLAVTNDSGISHLASAVGTPVLALFGPTHPVLGFAPRGLRDRVMQVEEFCRPCSRHGRKACWREERYCFTRLAAEEVIKAAGEMLAVSASLTPGLLVDRDGTMIVNKHYLADPDDVQLIDGVPEALRRVRRQGYRIVVISNQSGVARGLHSYADVQKVNMRVKEMLADQGEMIDGMYFCPHHNRKGRAPDFAVDCRCRKPSPGMAEQAALEHGLDLRRSVVVGDSIPDIALGWVIGARSILVRTGYGATILETRPDRVKRAKIEVTDNLLTAAELLSGTISSRT